MIFLSSLFFSGLSFTGSYKHEKIPLFIFAGRTVRIELVISLFIYLLYSSREAQQHPKMESTLK